jgi:hypothetical protein
VSSPVPAALLLNPSCRHNCFPFFSFRCCI